VPLPLPFPLPFPRSAALGYPCPRSGCCRLPRLGAACARPGRTRGPAL